MEEICTSTDSEENTRRRTLYDGDRDIANIARLVWFSLVDYTKNAEITITKEKFLMFFVLMEYALTEGSAKEMDSLKKGRLYWKSYFQQKQKYMDQVTFTDYFYLLVEKKICAIDDMPYAWAICSAVIDFKSKITKLKSKNEIQFVVRATLVDIWKDQSKFSNSLGDNLYISRNREFYLEELEAKRLKKEAEDRKLLEAEERRKREEAASLATSSNTPTPNTARSRGSIMSGHSGGSASRRRKTTLLHRRASSNHGLSISLHDCDDSDEDDHHHHDEHTRASTHTGGTPDTSTEDADSNVAVTSAPLIAVVHRATKLHKPKRRPVDPPMAPPTLTAPEVQEEVLLTITPVPPASTHTPIPLLLPLPDISRSRTTSSEQPAPLLKHKTVSELIQFLIDEAEAARTPALTTHDLPNDEHLQPIQIITALPMTMNYSITHEDLNTNLNKDVNTHVNTNVNVEIDETPFYKPTNKSPASSPKSITPNPNKKPTRNNLVAFLLDRANYESKHPHPNSIPRAPNPNTSTLFRHSLAPNHSLPAHMRKSVKDLSKPRTTIQAFDDIVEGTVQFTRTGTGRSSPTSPLLPQPRLSPPRKSSPDIKNINIKEIFSASCRNPSTSSNLYQTPNLSSLPRLEYTRPTDSKEKDKETSTMKKLNKKTFVHVIHDNDKGNMNHQDISDDLHLRQGLGLQPRGFGLEVVKECDQEHEYEHDETSSYSSVLKEIVETQFEFPSSLSVSEILTMHKISQGQEGDEVCLDLGLVGKEGRGREGLEMMVDDEQGGVHGEANPAVDVDVNANVLVALDAFHLTDGAHITHTDDEYGYCDDGDGDASHSSGENETHKQGGGNNHLIQLSLPSINISTKESSSHLFTSVLMKTASTSATTYRSHSAGSTEYSTRNAYGRMTHASKLRKSVNIHSRSLENFYHHKYVVNAGLGGGKSTAVSYDDTFLADMNKIHKYINNTKNIETNTKNNNYENNNNFDGDNDYSTHDNNNNNNNFQLSSKFSFFLNKDPQYARRAMVEMWNILVSPENNISELKKVFKTIGIKGSYSLAYCQEEDFRCLAGPLTKPRKKAFLALAELS